MDTDTSPNPNPSLLLTSTDSQQKGLRQAVVQQQETSRQSSVWKEDRVFPPTTGKLLHTHRNGSDPTEKPCRGTCTQMPQLGNRDPTINALILQAGKSV